MPYCAESMRAVAHCPNILTEREGWAEDAWAYNELGVSGPQVSFDM